MVLEADAAPAGRPRPNTFMDKLARYALPAALLGVVLSFVSVTRADPDLWGHVRFGTDILEQRALHRDDTYSFTDDRPWVNHEWLTEVAMALAYGAGGAVGLVLLKLAVIAGVALCLASIARRDGADARGTVIVVAFGLVGVLTRVHAVRPQMFSVLLFAMLLWMLRRAERRPSVLVAAPLLMVIWANSHGGWLVGLATLVAWCVLHAAVHLRDRRRVALLAAVCLAAAAATLVTPYGLELWRFLATTVRPTRRFIDEWGPIYAAPVTLLTWIACWALFAVAVVRGRPRPSMVAIAIPMIWGVAAFRTSRLDSFFALSTLALLTPQILQVVHRQRTRPRALPMPAAAALATAAIALTLALPSAARNTACIGVAPTTMPEAEAMRYVRDRQLAGRMLTFFDWGQYTIWHMPPGLQVSMDGRRETVYTHETIDAHLDLYLASQGWTSYLDALRPDYVWLPRRLPLPDALERSGAWVALYRGPQSVILARAGSVVEAAHGNGQEPAPEPRCFPGP